MASSRHSRHASVNVNGRRHQPSAASSSVSSSSGSSTHQRSSSLQAAEQPFEVKMDEYGAMSAMINKLTRDLQPIQRAMRDCRTTSQLANLRDRVERFGLVFSGCSDAMVPIVAKRKDVTRKDQIANITIAFDSLSIDVRAMEKQFQLFVANTDFIDDTAPVVSTTLSASAVAMLQEEQSKVDHHRDPGLLQQLAAKDGFVPYDEADAVVAEAKVFNKEVHKIETEVLVVKEMFDDVRDLVKGQQPMIDKMAANIERTRDHVELADREITKADRADKKGSCVIS